MKTLEQLKAEAKERGIVPGVRVRCAFMDGETFIMPDWSLLKTNGGHDLFADDITKTTAGGDTYCNNAYVFNGDAAWAEVITPAPQQEQGLENGDACECSAAMRAAIVELAKGLGVALCDMYPPGSEGINDIRWCEGELWRHNRGSLGVRLVTPEAFIAKMLVTAKKPKPEPPIMINVDDTDRKVIFKSGHITVGCTNVDNATVRAIASKLID